MLPSLPPPRINVFIFPPPYVPSLSEFSFNPPLPLLLARIVYFPKPGGSSLFYAGLLSFVRVPLSYFTIFLFILFFPPLFSNRPIFIALPPNATFFPAAFFFPGRRALSMSYFLISYNPPPFFPPFVAKSAFCKNGSFLFFKVFPPTPVLPFFCLPNDVPFRKSVLCAGISGNHFLFFPFSG